MHLLSSPVGDGWRQCGYFRYREAWHPPLSGVHQLGSTRRDVRRRRARDGGEEAWLEPSRLDDRCKVCGSQGGPGDDLEVAKVRNQTAMGNKAL